MTDSELKGNFQNRNSNHVLHLFSKLLWQKGFKNKQIKTKTVVSKVHALFLWSPNNQNEAGRSGSLGPECSRMLQVSPSRKVPRYTSEQMQTMSFPVHAPKASILWQLHLKPHLLIRKSIYRQGLGCLSLHAVVNYDFHWQYVGG